MRDLPIVFPISLAIIVAMLLFTTAYAVSANAAAGQPIYSSTLSPAGIVAPNSPDGTASSDDDRGYGWYEKAAFFVCPLH